MITSQSHNHSRSTEATQSDDGSWLALALGAVGVALVSAILCLYFAPSLLASHRNHSQLDALRLFNVCLGWTGAGWVGALIWASFPSNIGRKVSLAPVSYGLPALKRR